MEWYLGQEAFVGKTKTVKQLFEQLDDVTQEDVKKVAHDVIKNEKLNMAVIGPFPDKSVFEKNLKV